MYIRIPLICNTAYIILHAYPADTYTYIHISPYTYTQIDHQPDIISTKQNMPINPPCPKIGPK